MRLPNTIEEGIRVGAGPLFAVVWVPLIYTLMQSMPVQLRVWRQFDTYWDRTSVILEDAKEFDFIIVGAGLAGGVVANRLSEKGHSVLLMEAGGEPYQFQLIPGLLMLMINNPETDWMYRSVPQTKGSLNSVNRESSWSVGKGLGGSGTLNIMIYLRGHQKDFDNWAKIVNDSSWSFNGVLPHFRNIENYTDKPGPVDLRYHGTSGELSIDEPDYLGLADEFIAAGQELGYPKVDLNAPYTEGFDKVKYPISQGRRTASYSAFILPARSRKTLTILKYAHVNKVLLRDDNTAYGVQYERHGEIKTAIAKKEVILSAGSVSSAQILMLSGIGPKDHLQDLGIPVKKDLPVGQGLEDHIGVYLHPFFINKPRTIRVDRDISLRTVMDWAQHGTGVLSSSGVQASGCIASSYAKARGEGDWPDIHYFLYGFSASTPIAKYVSNAFNLEPEEMERYYRHGNGRDSFYIIVTGARPFSRGFVKLRSTHPKDHPVIDPKYLNDMEDIDLKVLLEATKTAVKMVENSTAIGVNLGGRFTTEKLPGCEHLELRSDAYWVCYIRRYSVTLHHPVGTARMGKVGSPEAVVDPRLRVIGIKGLRVVDSSIHPKIIVTNTGASAMMIGEKGASMILDDWDYKMPPNWAFPTSPLDNSLHIIHTNDIDSNDLRLHRKLIPQSE